MTSHRKTSRKTEKIVVNTYTDNPSPVRHVDLIESYGDVYALASAWYETFGEGWDYTTNGIRAVLIADVAGVVLEHCFGARGQDVWHTMAKAYAKPLVSGVRGGNELARKSYDTFRLVAEAGRFSENLERLGIHDRRRLEEKRIDAREVHRAVVASADYMWDVEGN